MRVAKVLEETNIPNYSYALLTTESRKTCTHLAVSIAQSHDKLYRPFKDACTHTHALRDRLLGIVKSELTCKPMYLIFDDSQLSKPHARDIEGLDISFDGSTGRPELGLQIVTALITDGNLRIPVDLKPYFSKDVAGDYFKTKSNLASTITIDLIKQFDFKFVLADAHYATKQYMSLLYGLQQNFLMKFSRNRIVKIGQKQGQLKDLLKLRRNEHSRSVAGSFSNIPCCFYVVKLTSGVIAYFISLYPIERTQLIALYRIRWNIELYHRTAKQYLGWNDCQMRAIEKQELHSLYVMYAYAIAELIRVKMKFNSTEDAIRYVAASKTDSSSYQVSSAGENLC